MGENFAMILCITLTCVIWAFLIRKNWRWFLSKFKKKQTFEEAIKALKEGATIYRPEISYTTYKSRTITEDGKSYKEWGMIRNDSFEKGVFFDSSDVFADDWIIEGK
jgi:hypothetical protein